MWGGPGTLGVINSSLLTEVSEFKHGIECLSHYYYNIHEAFVDTLALVQQQGEANIRYSKITF